MRALYPPDWPEISRRVRFDRAGGRCEACGRPHRRLVYSLPDGRWLDGAAGWRSDAGAPVEPPELAELAAMRLGRVVLTTAHLDHDPANNADDNLRALCGRCHLANDQEHHARMRWLRWRLRWAMADLLELQR